MHMNLLRIYNHAERQPGNGIQVVQYAPDPWDAFVEQDEVFVTHWEKILETFPEYTLYICNQEDTLLASATAAPLFFDDSFQSLPDGGWRWVIETALLTSHSARQVNLVSALGIHVVPSWRGRGLSKIALELIRKSASEHGFKNLVAPVRPSQKHLYPLIPMEEYVSWTRDDGYCFDAWLRTHQRLGADILKVAYESVVVKGKVRQWEAWAQFQFPGSGKYILPGALVPIFIDRSADEGIYVEPNVWMVHPLTVSTSPAVLSAFDANG